MMLVLQVLVLVWVNAALAYGAGAMMSVAIISVLRLDQNKWAEAILYPVTVLTFIGLEYWQWMIW